MYAVRVSLIVFAFFFSLLGARGAQAQLPAGPVLINSTCLPDNSGIVPLPACIITLMTPSVMDLTCVRFINVKTFSTIDLPVDATLNPLGTDCVPASPSTMISVRMTRPTIGAGHVMYVARGDRTVGITAASLTTGIVVDVSFPTYFQRVICPVRSLSEPFDDPLCPQVSNDIGAGEFPNNQ